MDKKDYFVIFVLIIVTGLSCLIAAEENISDSASDNLSGNAPVQNEIIIGLNDENLSSAINNSGDSAIADVNSAEPDAMDAIDDVNIAEETTIDSIDEISINNALPNDSINNIQSPEKKAIKSKKKIPGFNLEIPRQKESEPNKAKTNANKVLPNPAQKSNPKRKVIITLKDPESINEWKPKISGLSKRQKQVLKDTIRNYAINNAGRQNVKYRFKSFNGFSATLSQEEIDLLTASGLVERIEEDKLVRLMLQDSTNIINATRTWAVQSNSSINLTGKGQTICIIDSGINYSHADLGGCNLTRIQNGAVESHGLNSTSYPAEYGDAVDETFTVTKPGYSRIAVFFTNVSLEEGYDFIDILDSSNNVIDTYTGNMYNFWSLSVPGDTIKIHMYTDFGNDFCGVGDACNGFSINATKNATSDIMHNWSNCTKVIGGYDFANSDSDPMDDHGHGTHVAGIAAANGRIKGAAPDAKLFAVKSMSPLGGWDSDIIAGIEYCNENAVQYNISVISMSLGGAAHYADYCDGSESAMSAAVNNSYAKNITVVAASGNDGNYTGIISPACLKNVIPIGATDKSDNLASFSNRNILVSLFATGVSINSTWVNGAYSIQSGTSMATPNSAGAFAIMRQSLSIMNKTMSPRQMEQAFNSTGKRLDDTGNSNLNYSRINIYEALKSIDDGVVVSVTNPSADGIWHNYNINVSYFASGAYLRSCWWTNDSGAHNYSLTCGQNITGQAWSQGLNNVTIYANDSFGMTNSSARGFYIDTIIPSVNISFPSANGVWFNSSINLILNVTDTNLQTCWWTRDNGATNTTITCGQNITGQAWSQGQNNITVYANDSAGNSNYSTRQFNIDTNAPSCTNKYSYPSIERTDGNYTINATCTDNIGLSRVRLNFNGTNYTTLNNTANEFYYVISNSSIGFQNGADYNYSFWANDSVGNTFQSSAYQFQVLRLGANASVANASQSYIANGSNISQIILPTSSPTTLISTNSTAGIYVNLSFLNDLAAPQNYTLPSNLTLKRESASANYSVFFQNSTVMTASSSWDETLDLPFISNASSYSIASGTIDVVVDMGSDVEINFSAPAKIVIGGMSGKRAAWTRGTGAMTAISLQCNDINNPTNINPTSARECYGDSSSDLVIWTYHFTTFGAYTPTTEESGGNSGGGGGGGGGSGGSGGGAVNTSTYNNLEVFSRIRVNAGEQVDMVIDKTEIPFTEISFTANETLVKINIKVRGLNDSAGLPFLENAFKYLEVTTIFLTKGFSNPRIKFKVDNAWLNRNNYDPDSVLLYRLEDGIWNALETKKTGADASNTYYQSVTPGFSYFAIAAKNAVPDGNMGGRQSSQGQTLSPAGNNDLTYDESNATNLTKPRASQTKGWANDWMRNIIAPIIIIAAVLIIIISALFFVFGRRKQEPDS